MSGSSTTKPGIKLALALAAALTATTALAEEPAPDSPSRSAPLLKTVYGELTLPDGCKPSVRYLRQVQKIDISLPSGEKAWVLFPPQPPPEDLRPWVLYAPVDMGNTWIWERLLDAGFAIAAVPSVGYWMGKPEARAAVSELYDIVTATFGFDKQVCLMPQSKGGLLCYNWAADNPEKVRCIGGIYPATDILSWPGGGRAENALSKYAAYDSRAKDKTVEEFLQMLPDFNPIDRLAPLADHHIPIFHVHGAMDGAVPLRRNSLDLQERYQALGGEMEVDVVPGKGHEECPEIFHSQRLVDFFLEHGLKE